MQSGFSGQKPQYYPSQVEWYEHDQTWKNRAYVGETRKPALLPEADITTDSWVIVAESMKLNNPGVIVQIVQITGIQASQHEDAQKVWIVREYGNRPESVQDAYSAQAEPYWQITSNRSFYIIRTSDVKYDNQEAMAQAAQDYTSRAFDGLV